jgi:hypothetical protein
MSLPLSHPPALVNERKFVGDLADRPFVLGLLDAWLPPDRRHGTGHVNSVYFDTPGLRSWNEKANGDNLKRKVRARWYGRPGDLGRETSVFLELKRRVGSARDKSRVETKVPSDLLLRAPLSDPAWPALFAANADRLGEPVGPDWTPVCRVEYDRVRYDDPENGGRVAVDWDISAVPNGERFPWAAPVALGALVCEFKNRGGSPPRWSEALRNAGLRLRSFSKYGECMLRIVNGIP